MCANVTITITIVWMEVIINNEVGNCEQSCMNKIAKLSFESFRNIFYIFFEIPENE